VVFQKLLLKEPLGKLIVTIHTSKPGIIIGKGGGEVDRIKEELKKLTNKEDVQINILEIRRPELDAMIVADTVARQIENRINYKRAIKMSIASALRMGAEGIKVKVAGRLGGAEIARTEEIKQGRVPLHTFRMDIDYANVFALTVYGKIGIKVWICKGEVLAKRDLNPNFVGGKSDVSDRRERRDMDSRGGDRRDDRRGGGGGERRGGGGGVEEVAVVKAEEVADPVVVEEVVDLVVVVEVAVAEEQVAAVEEEDKFETKIKNKKLVTRNFIKCYNRKDRNTGKCRKAV
jgi:small subunit ribosomal protein S3